MEKFEQWSQEKVIQKPSKKVLKEYYLSKKEIHYNAFEGKTIVMETYSKGHWSMYPDIHHTYEE